LGVKMPLDSRSLAMANAGPPTELPVLSRALNKEQMVLL
jgi:hypothetical protein